MYLKNLKLIIKFDSPHQILYQFNNLLKNEPASVAQIGGSDIAKVIGTNRFFLDKPPIAIKGKFQHDILLQLPDNSQTAFEALKVEKNDTEASVFRNAKSALNGYIVPTFSFDEIRGWLPDKFLKEGPVQAEILAYYMQDGNFKGAEAFAEQNLDESASKHAVVALLRVLAEGGMAERVEELFKKWFISEKAPHKVSIDAVNAVIRAHVKAGNSSKARKCRELLTERYKIEPNAETELLIASLSAEHGNVAPILQLIEKFDSIKRADNGHFPFTNANKHEKTAAWNLLLQSYLVKEGNGLGGVMDRVFESMTVTRRIPFDSETLTLMIYAHAKPGQVCLKKALKYFCSTSAFVRLPSRGMFEAIMAAFVNAGESDRAWRIYASMLSINCPRGELSLFPLTENALAYPERLEESIQVSGILPSQYPLLAKDFLSSLLRVYPKYVTDKDLLDQRRQLAGQFMSILSTNELASASFVTVSNTGQRFRAYSVDTSEPLRPAERDWAKSKAVVDELDYMKAF